MRGYYRRRHMSVTLSRMSHCQEMQSTSTTLSHCTLSTRKEFLINIIEESWNTCRAAVSIAGGGLPNPSIDAITTK